MTSATESERAAVLRQAESLNAGPTGGSPNELPALLRRLVPLAKGAPDALRSALLAVERFFRTARAQASGPGNGQKRSSRRSVSRGGGPRCDVPRSSWLLLSAAHPRA